MVLNSNSFLSEEFLAKYEGVKPKNQGIMFLPLYLRTYSRYIPEKRRRETWLETVARVTNYNISLYQGPASFEILAQEAELMFDKIFHLEVLPSGRSLWIGGTETAQKMPESNFNCFSRETVFLTDQGYKSFYDFEDGDTVTVLGRHSGWKKATIKNFGKDRLYRITLRRGKSSKIFYSTKNHRWIIKKYGKNLYKTTEELSKKDILPVVRNLSNLSEASKITPCPVAIKHGMVFGDGTFVKSTGYCMIDLCDESQQFTSIFTGHKIKEEGVRGGEITGRHTRITNLPWNWKDLPSLSANYEYLLGFLMGWFAADGSFSSTQSSLSSSNKENLEWARSALALLGIYTSEIRIGRAENPFNGESCPLYCLGIFKEYLSAEFFLKKEHKEKFNNSPEQKKMDWSVFSVEATNRYEDVWCVQEPEQECFVLENGILTRNCAFLSMTKLEDFCDVFHLLLCGCGVGYRVLKEDVINMPLLNTSFEVIHNEYISKHPATREELTQTAIDELSFFSGKGHTYKIEIGDSRRGWVEALRQFLHFLTIQNSKPITIVLNYDSIRPAGERIKTAGGIAPGPFGLRDMFIKLEKLIKKTEGILSAVDVMDINNILAENVIVGGTRRSAQIALGSPNDFEFITAKRNLYQVIDGKWVRDEERQHRTMSNNTVVFSHRPSFKEIQEIFHNIKDNGEPGFMNLEAASRRRPNANGLNPCKPLSSSILTPKGYITFEEALKAEGDIKVILPSGRIAKATKPFKTGSNREVYKVTLSNGLYILGTGNHQHKLKSGEWKEIRDLNVNDRLEYSLPLKASADIHDYEEYRLGLITGWTYAEGSIGKRSDSSGYSVQVSFGVNEFDCVPMMERMFDLETKPHGQKPETCRVIQTHRNAVAIEMIDTGYDYKDKSNLTWLFKKSKDFKLGFIRAAFTTDGSVRRNCVELYSEHREALVSMSLVLQEFGIYSGVSCHGKAKSYMARDGKIRNNKDCWKLIVYGDQFKSIGFISEFKNSLAEQRLVRKFSLKKVHVKVKSIDLHSIEDVYDITVDDESHSFIDGGITTHNCAEILLDSYGVCNLSSIVLSSHIRNGKLDLDRLEESVRLAARIGLRQTNVNLSLPNWDEVQKRDRLTGVSMTGVMDTWDRLGVSFDSDYAISTLEFMRMAANKEADSYSFEMRISRPLLVTTIKPEGSLSLLPTVSPGLHRSYAPYYIRRMRVSELDPVCKALTELGVPHERDITKKNSTRIVFSFPIASGASISANDESALSQFNRYLTMQKYYTDHNSSCTLTVGEGEWEDIAKSVYDNWDDIIACAFLPKSTIPYPQMPLEAITKERYDEMMQSFPDLSNLAEVVNHYEGLEEEYELEDECQSGSCPTR